VLLTVRVIKTLKGPMGLFEIIDAKVDIDGSKHHLEETNIACAQHELEEETHISLDTCFYDSAMINNNVD
jgi:plastocyanin domain-containing protein